MIPLLDERFGQQLLALWGKDITLQDASTLRAIQYDVEATDISVGANTFREAYVLYFRQSAQGTLRAQQTVTIDNALWFVTGISPLGRGWMQAPIEKQ